jgi:hypothetical protein
LGKSQLTTFCHTLSTNLTQHDPHELDEQPKTIDYHFLHMLRDIGKDEHGVDWLFGWHLVGFWLGSWASHSYNEFLSRPDHSSDPANDSHGPDEQSKTIDYHPRPLHMSRDIGKDEHGVDWLFG